MAKKPIPKHVSPAQSDPVTRARMAIEDAFIGTTFGLYDAREIVKAIDELIQLRIKEALK